MTQNTSDLDLAVDVVAMRLTQVADDPLLASKIIASLPERTTWFGWWMPRLAGAAIVLAAVLTNVRLSFDDRQTNVASNAPVNDGGTLIERPSNDRRTPIERPSNDRRTPVERPSNVRRTRVERVEPLKPLEPQAVDHEFSLPALDVEALPPMSMPVATSIDLAPLALGDLPLSGEFPERH